MKILCIGDAHFKDNLGYSEYISDKRVAEKKEILDFLIKQAEDCQHIVFMGDNFNSKNNSSETNREFVALLERFQDKEVYILAGNHEKKGDGKTAIDFLGEVKKANWHIFTKPGSIPIEGTRTFKFDFLPYMLNFELESENAEESTKKIINQLDGGDILFAHHTISGSSWNGIKAESLTYEVVLPREELEKKYKLIIAGHIHTPQQIGNTLITGSLFSKEVGEIERFVYKIDEELKLEKIKVPCREIHKLENPTAKQLLSIPKSSIIKCIITNREYDIEELEKELSKFDAHLLIEDYPEGRKKMKIEESAFDFSIESLLKLYAEEKDVDLSKLLKGLQIINNNG